MDELFDKFIKGATDRLLKVDKVIYNILLAYLIDNLTVSNDKVKYNARNIDVINRMETATDNIPSPFDNLVKWVLQGISAILGETVADLVKYDVRAKKTGKDVHDTLIDHAATSLNQILSLQQIYSDLKQTSLVLMSRPDGISLGELREALQNKVVGDKIASRYFARWTHDLYSQYQRVGANRVRLDLGLVYAIYQGGLIESSRPFCISRNNKVFHESEVKKWVNLNFEGKPETGYNPLIDLGGYNCRHRLDWISEELAFKLRPELEKMKFD